MSEKQQENRRSRHFYGWDDPWTARQYESFYAAHNRYRQANASLIRHADIDQGMTVLDFAAGSGRTAEMILPFIGRHGRIVCVEPASAMRQLGRKRLTDSRIRWSTDIPDATVFDRILCGAAIWQIDPLEDLFSRLVGLLMPGGALCFNIPGLYLGQADEPGGGQDPWLLSLPATLQNSRSITGEPGSIERIPGIEQLEALLISVGLRPQRWSFQIKFSQTAYRDWLKIPVLTNRLLPNLTPQERILQIDSAYRRVPHDSWRWERWFGWTARKDFSQED